MELLLMLLAGTVIAVAYLVFVSVDRRTYRIKYRDKAPVQRQGRSANRTGPDWEEMLE